MKKLCFICVVVLVMMSWLTVSAFAESKRILFIPKITTENFFIQAGKGALEMGKELGVEVTYDGPEVASVSQQAKYITKYVKEGYDAIAISSVSPDGLNRVLKKAMEKGVKIITWDSEPKCLSRFVQSSLSPLF